MAVHVREHGGVARRRIPVTAPRIRGRFVVVGASIAAGVLAGWLAYVLVSGGEDLARVQEIQGSRAEALVEAYEAQWARLQRPGSPSRGRGRVWRSWRTCRARGPRT